MRNYYDWIYLSPHLDDVALSCGGQIAHYTAAGQTALIVSVMAGDPPENQVSGYAQSLHARWQLATDAAAGRRAEDLAACAILGADALHWTVPDCIYRYHPVTGAPFYGSDADIFGAVDPAELNLVDTLTRWMQGLPDHGQVVAPLTVGHHVDHQLTRAAAERWAGAHALSYYEDYPYAQQPGKLAQVIDPCAPMWRAEIIPVPPAALQAKIEAVTAFRSQLSTFFTDKQDLAAQIAGFAADRGGERIWRYLS